MQRVEFYSLGLPILQVAHATCFYLRGIMHLLYLDESGSVPDKAQQYFVLAGVSVSETRTHWIEQELNKIALNFSPNPYEIELHGSPMRSGRDGWKRYPLDVRLQAITNSLLAGVFNQRPGCVRVFGVVVKKSQLIGVDPVEYAFEQLVQMFDLFLGRTNRKLNPNQRQTRGIMIFDKSTTENRIQALAREFKHSGHTYGKTRNYAEVPVFLDSKASRLIQLADLVAFSIFRKFEYDDSSFYDLISPSFDREGSVIHGLHIVDVSPPLQSSLF
jgi:hypothetical protein